MEMENNLTPLGLDDRFGFACSKDVPCFNGCCKDLNQFLTPYDILRLKNNLGVSSTVFLERNTSQHTGPASGLPVVTLKPADATRLTCRFVTTQGCRVYPDRPSSCRLYPIARVVSRSRADGQKREQYMLLKEPHCQGFDQNQHRTVRQWLDDQDAVIYNQMNDPLLDLISMKNALIPGALDLRSHHMFQLALYDTDRFRARILNQAFSSDLNLSAAVMETVQIDDTALLQIGFRWIRHMLFGAV